MVLAVQRVEDAMCAAVEHVGVDLGGGHVFVAQQLLGSTTVLLLPWRWHQRFARVSVPRAARRLGVIGK